MTETTIRVQKLDEYLAEAELPAEGDDLEAELVADGVPPETAKRLVAAREKGSAEGQYKHGMTRTADKAGWLTINLHRSIEYHSYDKSYRVVLDAVANHANGNGDQCAGPDRLARESGLGKREVQYVLAAACRAGVLVKKGKCRECGTTVHGFADRFVSERPSKAELRRSQKDLDKFLARRKPVRVPRKVST